MQTNLKTAEAFHWHFSLGLLIGLFFAVVVCEPIVRSIIRRVRVDPLPLPEPLSSSRKLVPFVGEKGARWVGRLERGLFFIGFLQGSPEIIAGWLLFKLGSKWESWHNIIRVPESLKEVDTTEFLRYRHAWGVSTMQSFLAGTLADILSGLGGVVVTRWTIEMLGG